ncbi:uncharacterized protein [Diabrotica undecimpunctata]|uniref:uncharacterized protein n=1 Tax=Diabrotica undecimpunctata TaxID=50387 RepID=UPI003B635038
MNICNIYIPPTQNPSTNEILDLIKQIPSPRLIVGDINAHNYIWGSNKITPLGRRIEIMLDNFQLNLLNDGRNTHFDISTGKSSAIDLSICDPALSITLSWDVLSDLNDSDHFPIVITNSDSIQYSCNVEKWNLKNANWQEYYNLVLNEINALHEILQLNNNIDSQIQEFSNVLLNAAEKAVGKMNSKQLNLSVPWWNSECQEAIKLSNTALN